MNTEQHVWTSSHRAPVAGGPTFPVVCGCGQDLDLCAGAHCPRCGTSTAAFAA